MGDEVEVVVEETESLRTVVNSMTTVVPSEVDEDVAAHEVPKSSTLKTPTLSRASPKLVHARVSFFDRPISLADFYIKRYANMKYTIPILYHCPISTL